MPIGLELTLFLFSSPSVDAVSFVLLASASVSDNNVGVSLSLSFDESVFSGSLPFPFPSLLVAKVAWRTLQHRLPVIPSDMLGNDLFRLWEVLVFALKLFWLLYEKAGKDDCSLVTCESSVVMSDWVNKPEY